jgi:hypothetical protein
VLELPRVDEHLLTMLILGLALYVRGLHARVNRIKVPVFSGTMHQVHHSDPFEHARLIPTGLRPHQLHEAGIPFILDTILHEDKSVLAILDPVFDQFPHLPRQEAFLVQKIVDHVVTHVLQMVGQLGTRAVLRRAHHILNVLLLGNHTRKMLFFALKRKSCRKDKEIW